MNFEKFPKIPRSGNFEYLATEKIDGTNAQICFEKIDGLKLLDQFKTNTSRYVEGPDGIYRVFAGSRNRLITPEKDNFGFAKYVWDNAEELIKLGEGRHFGEWYGSGIQRGYGLNEKRFALLM